MRVSQLSGNMTRVLTSASVIFVPNLALADQLTTKVNRATELVTQVALTTAWFFVLLYTIILGVQWAMGDGGAAKNWWKPIAGAIIVGSAQSLVRMFQ